MDTRQPSAETFGNGGSDDLDRIVPPPGSKRRLWALLTVAFGAGLIALALPATGLLSPNLRGVLRNQCGEVCPTGDTDLGFEIRNEGLVVAEIAEVDARAAGLSDPSVSVQALRGPPYSDTGGPWLSLPARLEPGEGLLVHVRYAAVDCAAVDPDPRRSTIPVSARGPLGLPVSVGVTPWEFTRPHTGLRTYRVGNDPLAISWAAGVTWDHCNPR